jgi:hypothetical protein
VTPDGKYVVVAGKLDTHVSVYSIEKMKAIVQSGKFAGKDPYGIPIIGLQEALHKQVDLGLGPLDTSSIPRSASPTLRCTSTPWWRSGTTARASC